jgi:hypothetical protein
VTDLTDLTEPVPEPTPPSTTVEPVDPAVALSRKNMAWGFALFGIFLLLFVGTVLVALAYLWLD